MGPPLVIQVDRRGQLDVRGSATAFDLPRASSHESWWRLTSAPLVASSPTSHLHLGGRVWG